MKSTSTIIIWRAIWFGGKTEIIIIKRDPLANIKDTLKGHIYRLFRKVSFLFLAMGILSSKIIPEFIKRTG